MLDDGGMLYRWKPTERKHAPLDKECALFRPADPTRPWLMPVCSLADYLGVEMREPDDKIDPELVREYVANSKYWRGKDSTPNAHAARAAAMWLREEEDRRRLGYLVACLNGTPALGPDVHLRRQRVEWMREIEDILGLVRDR